MTVAGVMNIIYVAVSIFLKKTENEIIWYEINIAEFIGLTFLFLSKEIIYLFI